MNNYIRRIRRRVCREIIGVLQWPRVQIYKVLSQLHCGNRFDQSRHHQPVMMLGDGDIRIGQCHLGVWPSPFFFSGNIHIEARAESAKIQIGDNVWINNNAVIIAEQSEISIGNNTIIGTEFAVYDSDFHDLHPKRRMTGKGNNASVAIGQNVFIGSRVLVLKGSKIGDNSVIAAGSIVVGTIPGNCVAAGVPAKVINRLQMEQ